MKILVIFGTRPEAIKLAPLIHGLLEYPMFDVKVCLTGQHRQMVDQVLDIFDIKANFDLDVMSANQSLTDITCKVMTGVTDILKSWASDIVIVQGDTTTAFAGALASFYQKVPIAHIEAGLRTYNLLSPFPEEGNRRLISEIASYHFAPTQNSKQNLYNEGITENVFVTGNTVIDALLYASQYLDNNIKVVAECRNKFKDINFEGKVILVTGHRRENFGGGFDNICCALREISENNDVEIVYPVHLNPNVQNSVYNTLSGIPNIHLIEPLDYLSFVYLIKNCYLVMTDSGGVQEEAPTLGKPVVIMRDTTERQEGISAGTAVLAGVSRERIVEIVGSLLNDQKMYEKMSHASNPYGDGRATHNIISILKNG